MVMDFNPRNLKGELIKIYEHNMVFLNSSKKYQDSETPKNYQDWLDLLYASMKEPVNYKLNLNNKGIAKAVNLIDFDKLDPLTLQLMKEDEGRKEMEVLIERDSKYEIVENAIVEGYSNEQIQKITKLPLDIIEKIRNR